MNATQETAKRLIRLTRIKSNRLDPDQLKAASLAMSLNAVIAEHVRALPENSDPGENATAIVGALATVAGGILALDPSGLGAWVAGAEYLANMTVKAAVAHAHQGREGQSQN